MSDGNETLTVRPYQLMCMVCKIGAGRGDDLGNARLNEILKAVRENPIIPVALRCNVDSVYRFQSPGRDEDTPEGELFNDKRDLDILQRLGLVAGDTRPAGELFLRLFANISTGRGICMYDEVTSGTWQGCADPDRGGYDKGHALGVDAIIPPRLAEEKAAVKKASVQAMYDADVLQIRPHHLMCMTCFHHGRECLEPIEEDNLFEAIDIMQKKPDIPVKLIAGCCMICPPCSKYDPKTGLCIGALGMSLRDQKKDLDALQLIGLEFGDTLPAADLLERLYDRIESAMQVCGYNDGVERAPEWRVCCKPENPRYEKGRAARLGMR